MPPKDHDPSGKGALFFSADGKTYEPFGKVEDAELILDDLVPEKGVKLPFVKPDEEISLSFKFDIRQNPSLFMLLWTGKWPSNNWLKMHGFPMRRRMKGR